MENVQLTQAESAVIIGYMGHITLDILLKDPALFTAVGKLSGVLQAGEGRRKVYKILSVDGQKIPAIKFIRAITGLGLKEAKDISDIVDANGYCTVEQHLVTKLPSSIAGHCVHFYETLI